MKTLQGDLIQLAKQGRFDIIAHGCNCFCTMNSGIAKQIKLHFPTAYEVDCETAKGDIGKLGLVSVARYGNLHIVNCYTQYKYGTDGNYLDYKALTSCLTILKMIAYGQRIGLPRIGCGLAGGDWSKVAQIIDSVLGNEDVTIVEYDNAGPGAI